MSSVNNTFPPPFHSDNDNPSHANSSFIKPFFPTEKAMAHSDLLTDFLAKKGNNKEMNTIAKSVDKEKIAFSDKAQIMLTIIASVLTAAGVIVGVMFSLNSTMISYNEVQIKASEAIRDESVAKFEAIAANISADLKGVRYEMDALRQELGANSRENDSKLEMQRLHIENQRLRDNQK